MVHYDPAPSVRSVTPFLCPKCGSHRTAVVGKSADDAVLIIRCNACGERSEIANPARDGFAAPIAADVASVMNKDVVGGDVRRRVRAGLTQA